MDFVTKYRPKNWLEVVGQEGIVKALKASRDWRAVLLQGPSGVGKTTIARILAMHMNCKEDMLNSPCGMCNACLSIQSGGMDYREENVGDSRGIDAVRAMVEWLYVKPLILSKKILVLDECHQLTVPAQNLLLKVLEEPPPGVSIILCTTNASLLLETVRQRCSGFNLSKVSDQDLITLLYKVIKNEQIDIESFSNSLPFLLQKADGTPRKLLMELEVLVRGGDITADLQVDKRIIDLYDEIVKGDLLSLKSVLLELMKNMSADDILAALSGLVVMKIKNEKNKLELIKLLALVEALRSDKRYLISREGEILVKLLVASLEYYRSFRREVENE